MISFGTGMNLDLLSVGIVAAVSGILGSIVFFNNRRSITNRTFLYFSLIGIIYAVINYISYQARSPYLVLWLLRFVVFFAFWYSYLLFQLLFVFPKEDMVFSKKYKFFLLPFIILISFLTLTPYVFSGIAFLAPAGEVSQAALGPAIILFGGMTISLVLGGFFLLVKKTIQATNNAEKNQFQIVLVGTLITYTLLIIFNLILPLVFDSFKFIPLAPVFTFPFLAFTFYAIIRYGLLNVKVIATEILTLVVIIITFSEILFSKTSGEIIFRVIVFTILLIFSILLIRSVRREVEQREKLQALTQELEKANEELKKLDEAKSEFISIASHQLRAPLTVIKGYVSMLLEGSLGAVTDLARDSMKKVFISAEQLVRLIADMLDLSRIEGGRMRYDFKRVMMDDIVAEVTRELEHTAKAKGLAFLFESRNTAKRAVNADSDKMREVVMNLIDNAIKYTSAGRVSIELYPENKDGREWLALKVQDTGIGIKSADIGKMFTKFARTEEAKRIRADGLGLGLYVVKKIVEDHGGRVRAESPGLGHGSTFFVELPTAER